MIPEEVNNVQSSNSDLKESNSFLNNEICMGSLLPAKLICIPLKLGLISYLALLDSGASCSFVSESVLIENNVNVDVTQVNQILNCGGELQTTKGCAHLSITMFGRRMDFKFHVLDDASIKYKFIIGADFLSKYNFVIDVFCRKITMNNCDGSLIHAHITDNNDIDNVQYENVPVFAKEDISLKSGEGKLLSVTSETLGLSDDFFYDGKHANMNLQCHCGIVNSGHTKVVIQNMHSVKTQKVKSGDEIGRVSSLLNLEVHSDNPESWNLDRLKNEVSVSHPLINDVNKSVVYNLLLENVEALSTGDSDVGLASVTPHHIQLTDYTPIWQRPRVFAEPVNREIESQCQELLNADIIESSNSAWSSPCVPVRKTDGSLRLCIDYRQVNNVTQTMKFPMPNLNHCLYKAHDIKFFTKLDLVRGYYQVQLDDDSKQYTAFSTLQNHFQFKRLPFGLKNSGIAFQKTMQEILLPLSNSNIIIYIDDILIMSHSFDEHLSLVGKVLQTLAKFHVKIKVKKCEFFVNKVNFLGHILSNEGLTKSPEFVSKVKDFERPTTITGLRQFLGLVNFQRKFIPKCAEMSRPLTELTGQKKKAKIDWTVERINAFNQLKQEIEKEICLSFPDYSPNAPKLELYVDASGIGAGACLLQNYNNDCVKTIGYASMTFSKTQQAYSTLERELAAIRWGCQIFRPFIFGVPFLLYTDHKPLTYMHNMSVHSSRIQRTLDELNEFDFEIKFYPGNLNCAADFLSRLGTGVEISDEPYTFHLPKGFKVLQKVDGGGDSMFEAALIALKDVLGEDSPSIPDSCHSLRKLAINELLSNPERYKLPTGRHERNKLKIMLNSGQLPCCETLLSISFLYNVEVRVFHDIPNPLVYCANSDKCEDVIYLQCISHVHYNPLYCRKVVEDVVDKKYVNVIQKLCLDDTNIFSGVPVDLNVQHSTLFEQTEKFCNHQRLGPSIPLLYNNQNLCTLIDTGAQICLINETSFNKVKTGNEIVHDTPGVTVVGLGGKTFSIVGFVNLRLSSNMELLNTEYPFAIVPDIALPCCVLLGINFLVNFKFVLDFSTKMCVLNKINYDMYYVQMLNDGNSKLSLCTFDVLESDDVASRMPNVRFNVSIDSLRSMQNSTHAIKLLYNKVVKQQSPKSWRENSLKQFCKHYLSLKLVDGLLVKSLGDQSAVVVSFPFLVEVLHKVHSQVAHLGRHKLLQVVRGQFWHPAMDRVSREICRCCEYCQLNKVNLQQVVPPTIKLEAPFPFYLVAIDLMTFPKSRNGNVAVLVVIDHFSKWMAAVPLKNKTATLVSNALRYVLPGLLKIPVHIMSDNGPEFRSQETEHVFEDFGIRHIYTSPYSPASNGVVERANRSLKDIIKGLTISFDV